MIRIGDQFYDKAHFDRRSAELGNLTGISPGLRYAVCFADTAEWLALFFAIRDAGASVLPIHPGTPYAAARKLAVQAGCERLLYNSFTGEILPDSAPRTPEGELLQMSSGTTGAPKLIARTWQNIEIEIASYVRTFTLPETMTPIVACPTTHSYGLICGILVGLHRGVTPHIVDTANPKHILKVMRESERPLLYSSPAILHMLAQLLPTGQRMHAAMTSGTLLPDPWFVRIREKCDHLFQQYGCSEAGCIAINPDLTAASDMGYILPHAEAETGEDLASAAEIVITKDTGQPIHTRDLGYRRADGMLVFVSRMDDMINVAGLNVYPKDVEDAVTAMPGITDAVAFRKSDRFAGERVALLFSAECPVSPGALREWLSRQLAPHQLPSEMIQVAEIPRQPNGKISRCDVAERHAAGAFLPVQTGVAS
ncbi:fatty-acyl-CoA synthase [Neorhizobium huautlense]|uniref:Fatty-acyl-CoA synthase n=1 Tax=Neorhizobium huautlense TaxID=67774 RepID=A0ABT9PQT9_9HYPH|nr:AMP-binding protein [Neorhizobium huautlense]MDP9836556.1 fatty-acyl-CoA synthase [Neorhizobium huautlense]